MAWTILVRIFPREFTVDVSRLIPWQALCTHVTSSRPRATLENPTFHLTSKGSIASRATVLSILHDLQDRSLTQRARKQSLSAAATQVMILLRITMSMGMT